MGRRCPFISPADERPLRCPDSQPLTSPSVVSSSPDTRKRALSTEATVFGDWPRAAWEMNA